MLIYLMELRSSKRIIINSPAEIIVGEKRYASTIENLSDKGLYVTTAPLKSPIDFSPDTLLELRFKLMSGEKLNLQCMVKWSYQTPPHGFTNSLGLEVMDPPQAYMEFLENLE